MTPASISLQGSPGFPGSQGPPGSRVSEMLYLLFIICGNLICRSSSSFGFTLCTTLSQTNPPLLCNAYLVMYDTHIEIKHRLLLLLPFVVLFPPQGPRGTPGVPGPLGETGLPVSSMNFYHPIFLYTIIVYI